MGGHAAVSGGKVFALIRSCATKSQRAKRMSIFACALLIAA